MKNIDFKFEFNGIGECDGTALVTNVNNSKMIVSSKIAVDDSRLFSSAFSEIPSVVADLEDLALAIHFADRMTPYGKGRSRHITICLPTRNPERLNESIVKMQQLLWWSTLDHWEFNFTLLTKKNRTVEFQKNIHLQGDESVEVALWSGGLDSLAGFLNCASKSPSTNYLFVGTGSNASAFEAQTRTLEKVRCHSKYHTGLVQIPLRWSNTDGLPSKNRYARSRGLVFLLLGSVVAYLQGQRKLFIYENGIGAINLPFNQAAKGIDHSRSVHPKSLLLTADLISGILGEEFSIDNPFLLTTKGEMCCVLQDYPPEILSDTLTCDRRQRNQYHECGWCSSCLLRRQALWVAGVDDPTKYYVPYGLKGHVPTSEQLRYFSAMVKQVRWLESSLVSSDPWGTLFRPFASALSFVSYDEEFNGIPESTIRNQVLDLYGRYVAEWERFEPVLRNSWFALESVDTFSRKSPAATHIQGDLFNAEEHS